MSKKYTSNNRNREDWNKINKSSQINNKSENSDDSSITEVAESSEGLKNALGTYKIMICTKISALKKIEMLNEKIDLSKDNSALKKDNLDLKKNFWFKKTCCFFNQK